MLTGTLTRMTSSSVDEYGDLIPGAPLTFNVEGFVDAYEDDYRIRAGIPEGDSRVTLILGNSETEPAKDDEISIAGWPTMKVRKVKIDPARATAECQSFEV